MKYSEDRLEELLKHEGITLSSDGYSYDNSGNGADFTLFRCYWCLNGYKTWEESRSCNCDKSGIPLQMVR